MKLVMSVSSRNENDDGGCVLACIDLTPGLAALALQRIESLGELQARDQDADEIYYWNYDAVFFDPFLGPSHEGERHDRLHQIFARHDVRHDPVSPSDMQTEINATAAASLLFQDVLQRTKAGLCEAFDTRTHPRL